jgi:hypothetical protein
VLAYRHAESGQRTHRKVARRNSAQISETNRLHLRGGKKKPQGAVGDHERRLQRLPEILEELVALTDWKKL